MEHAFVFKEQARAFLEYLKLRPHVVVRVHIILQGLRIMDPGAAEAMESGLGRLYILAVDPKTTVTTLDGLAQSFLQATWLVKDKDGDDILDDELREALGILGFPEIPRRQDNPEAYEAAVEAFVEKTGGHVEITGVTSPGAEIGPSAGLQ